LFAYVGPVLLLDVGVVVLLVGSSAGELDLVFLAVAHQVVVDEFGVYSGDSILKFSRKRKPGPKTKND